MKAAATYLVLFLANCAPGADPDTATAEDNAIVIRALPEVNTSCQWVPGKTCYGLPNDGDNIWPTGMGITTVHVLTRFGPTRLSGRQPTFLAFVVWNTSTVGRIFRIDVGDPGVNWRANLSNITAQRTAGAPDFDTGSAGTAVVGPVNPPHPNVEGPLTFEAPYLDNVKTQAGAIETASKAFFSMKAVGID